MSIQSCGASKVPSNTPPVGLSVNQAAAALGVGRNKLYDLINEKRLIARKLGARIIILASDLEACARSLPTIGAAHD
jgi:excisionase family DNA binding protein